jgi:hypothetical protein
MVVNSLRDAWEVHMHPHLRCRTCLRRWRQLGCLVFADGATGGALRHALFPNLDVLPESLAAAINRALKNPDLRIDGAYAPYLKPYAEREGQNGEKLYRHIYLPAAVGTKPSSTSPEYAQAMVRMFNKYLPLVRAMRIKLLEPDMAVSLGLFKEACAKNIGGYTNSIYQTGIRFLEDLLKVETEAEMFAFIENAWHDGSEKLVLPGYHQANKNILSALSSASNMDQLHALLKARTDPMNYQRKTAAPTAGQVAVARQMLGEFSVRYMTLDEAAKFIEEGTGGTFGIDLRQRGNGTAGMNVTASVYDKLQTKTKTPATQAASSSSRPTAASFAARAGHRTNSLKELIAYLTEHRSEITKVTLSASMSVAGAMVTTLEYPKVVKHPWLWAHRIRSQVDVRGDVEMILANATQVFVNFSGAKMAYDAYPDTACFPQYLSSDYHACGSTFEAFNKSAKLRPGEGDFFAVGNSLGDQAYVHPMTFSVTHTGGKVDTFTITRP